MNKQANELYEFGPFRVDPRERLLWRDGEALPLTPKAFETLLALVRNSGHLMLKNELMQAVWPDSFVEEVNLSQNISTLRKTLGDTVGENRYIVTVPGRGYRFAEKVKVVGEEQAEASLVVESPTSKHLVIQEQSPPLTPLFVRRKSPMRFTVLGALLALLVAAIGAYWLWTSRANAAHSSNRVMLAVLPFANMTGSETQEYLSDGLTEEIITELARLDPARVAVISRTSVMKFKRGSDLTQVRQQLGVDYVLEGALRSGSQRLGITVQLIRMSDQTHLWAQEYEIDPGDPLAWERNVAERTADALRLKLLPSVQRRHASVHTIKPEAREAYVRGRFLLAHRDASTFAQALEYFQKAAESEPDYAEAQAGIADAYFLLGNYGILNKSEAGPKAKAAALKALALDDTLTGPRRTLAGIRYEYELDFTGAGKDFRSAIESNANDAGAHQWYAGYLAAMGEFNEAIQEAKKAAELDPLSLHASVDLGRAYYFARQYDLAIAQFRKTLELDPNFARAHSQLGMALLEKGQYDEALAEIRKGVSGGVSIWLGYAYARAGKRAEAKEQLAAQLDRWRSLHDNAFGIASTYLGLGDKDEAFLWLEKDLQQGAYMIKAWPYWDPLRSDPRYQDLLRRMGLPL